MGGSLTSAQLQQFDTKGYCAGLPALSTAEVAEYRDGVMSLYSELDPGLNKHFINLHAVLGWAHRLGCNPQILDAVESLLGPDLMLWKSKAFVKFPGPSHVPWHQDVPHWNLLPEEAITAWVGLSDVHESNGCVRVLPGTHKQGSRAAAASADASSLLSAGIQFAVTEAEAAAAEPMLLKAGQISLHHGMVVHASGANDTEAPRIGIALSYIAANTTQRSVPDMHVALVRGQDKTRFFPASVPPAGPREQQMAAAASYFGKLKSGEIPYNVR